MARVSVIVPVYNGEKYISKCAGSILNQTMETMELILVDDGSTDTTAQICDQLAQQDSRVTVIHQKNAGVSAARNAGLAAATGEYIGFVDADDYIHEDTYRRACEHIGQCDIAMWDVVTLWDDGSTQEDTIPLLEKNCVIDKKDWSPDLLAMMAGSACRCLYRAELVKDVRFPVGVKLSEDRLFNLHAMGKAQKLSYFKDGLYMRYMRSDSAVHRYHGDKFEKSLVTMDTATQILNSFWGSQYLNAYTRLLVYQGALDAVYEICSPEFPGKKRIRAIRQITGSRELSQAFQGCPPVGLRQWLLQKKMNTVLCVVGYLFNWKRTLTEKLKVRK